MSKRSERIRDCFAALERGDVVALGDLFAEDAQWLGVPGSGDDGETPI